MSGFKAILSAWVIIGTFLGCNAFAATPAGSIILNQATATYFDNELDSGFSVLSTIASVRVKPKPNFALLNDVELQANAGETVVFSHIIENTGNQTDRYFVDAMPISSNLQLQEVRLFHDINQNGAVDPEDPQISETASLVPGSAISILLSGEVPTTAVAGQGYYGSIRAISQQDPNLVQVRMDVARITSDAAFRVLKSAMPNCATPVGENETIEYNLRFLNINKLQSSVIEYTIDGAIERGFIIEDEVPANTVLLEHAVSQVAPSSAIIVVRDASSGRLSAYENFIESDFVESIGIFIPESAMTSGQSGNLSFKVKPSENITPETVVTNVVAVDFDHDGQTDVESNPVCNMLAASGEGEEATIEFLEPNLAIRRAVAQANSQTKTVQFGPKHDVNSDYENTGLYRLENYPNYTVVGDGVYLQVRSSSFNKSSSLADRRDDDKFIRIKIESSKTGDTLYTRVLETEPNSGLFRVETPFRLSLTELGAGGDCGPTTEDQCVLKSAVGDVIGASIFDEGIRATLTAKASVNPQGVVFDSASMASVSGAEVNFINVDGSPAIDGLSGTPVPPQVTDETGLFTVPRLEDGQYAVSVTPPQDFTFPSQVAPSIFATRRVVDNRSYGLNGYLSRTDGTFTGEFTKQEPSFDIPLDPNLKQGQLQLQKQASQNTAVFGDFVEYELRVINRNDAVLFDVRVDDVMPRGFTYVAGSATLNGEPLDVVSGQNGLLQFNLGRMSISETGIVKYNLRVGPEARPGESTNRAIASGRTSGLLDSVSEQATATITIRDEGLFSDRAYIIGSVYVDRNGNGEKEAEELGIPHARIWFDDGTWVETDMRGDYSLYGIKPRTHIARLDNVTIPEFLTPKSHGSRYVSKGWSRIVDLTAGELHRANFALECKDVSTCLGREALSALVAERAETLDPNAILDAALSYEGLIGETVDNRSSRRGEQAGVDGDISAGLIRGARASAPIGGATPKAQVETAHAPIDDVETPAQMTPEALAKTLTVEDGKSGKWFWPQAEEGLDDVISRDGKFIVATRKGISPTLYIDGEAVDKSNLGTLIENKSAKSQLVAWYGLNLEAGHHEIEVRGKDFFGNTRVLAKMSVLKPGKPERLEIITPDTPAFSGGDAMTSVEVHILDAKGTPAMGTHFVTLSMDAFGERVESLILEADVQPKTPGHQVRVVNGVKRLSLKGPKKAGEYRVTASNGGELKTEQTLSFVEPMRDLMAVGLVELSGKKYSLSDLAEPALADEFPTEHDVDGRTSLFLKGRIKGDALLTFAYDSQKREDEGLFRDINPEAYYPIYGDASEKGFEAQSRSKVYVRVNKGGLSAMWGDFRTDIQNEESLTRTRRSLTGFNARAKDENWVGQVFAAETSEQVRVVRLRGRGTALDYQLPDAPIVRHSETLTVEVRDKDVPGLFVSETVLGVYQDYRIDDETGRLSLTAPLPSFDEFGNPVYLRARYETLGDGKEALTAGVRLNHETESSRVWAGLNYDEEGEIVDNRLTASVGAEVRTEKTRIWAEVGHMETTLIDDSKSNGNSARFGIETSVLGGELKAEGAFAEDDFENADAPILAGRVEGRTDFTRSIGKKTSLNAKATHSETLETGNARSTAVALMQTRLDNWTISAGPKYVRSKTEQEISTQTSAVLRVEHGLNIFGRKASTFIEGEQDLDESNARIKIGGDMNVREDTRIYASYALVDEIDDRTIVDGLTEFNDRNGQSRVVIGAETSILKNTTAYGEWRVADSLDGHTGEVGYGLRSSWEITDGITVAPQFEYSQNTGTDEEVDTSWSLSAAIADRRSETARRTLRAELRDTTNSTYYGARAAWAQRLNENVTGAIKVDGAYDQAKDAEDLTRVKVTAGLARRPSESRSTDWFALYQFLTEDGRGTSRDLHLISAHANREFSSRWTLSGRAASKWESFGEQKGSTQLLGSRLIYNHSEKWDFEANAGLRTLDWGDVTQTSAGIAAAFKPEDNVRVKLGYNFTGFDDRDLDPKGYNAHGLYWNVTVALDESWFGWLQ